ncbi:MAG: DUF2062 domain-containing protein [Myxococcales bacterium]|nr:DUF2062 domain-containing protein [Polyangiaceae bacterium]MDW8247938.1 DUF2062 domain-containing protein [Myxococcales bacterium]
MKGLERVRGLLRRALQEQTSPGRFALSVALGVLIGTSPLIGFQLLVAAALATTFRLNRALAVLGTNITFGPMLPLTVWGEVVLGARILGIDLPPISSETAMTIAREALGAWWVGFITVGPTMAAGIGGVVYAVKKSLPPPSSPG